MLGYTNIYGIALVTLLIGTLIGTQIGCARTPMQTAVEPFLIIAHRGASGYRPEHTLAAFELAIAQGADFIEPDLVPTRDGHLIVRHENALQGTTDVAQRAEFAERYATKTIDGREQSGWFSEDFTLAEIKTLWARERIPDIRPDNVAFNDRFRVASLREVIMLLQQPGNERVGLYPETKHPTYFLHEGRRLDGTAIAQDSSAMLLAVLRDTGFLDPQRLFIQSFEIANLRRLQHELMPAIGVQLPLVQLLGRPTSRPYDVHYHRAHNSNLQRLYGPLVKLLNGPATFEALASVEALQQMRADYAAGVGPNKVSISRVAANAAGTGLAVHAYTVRAEPEFLTSAPGGGLRSAHAEILRLRKLGATGVFVDQPDIGVKARAFIYGHADPQTAPTP